MASDPRPDDKPELSPEMQAQRQAMRGATPPARVYLIRHGEPGRDDMNRCYGQEDVPLGERGIRQSHALADRLRDVPLDAVYSSDLQRAGYMADLLAEPRDLPVRRLAALRERSMGELQGYTFDELERRFPEQWMAWRAERIHHRVAGAENFDDLRDRVVPAIMELVAAFPGRRVAVATHAGPIRVAVADALGLSLDHIFRLAVNHCGLFVIEYPHDDSPRVTLMNG